MSVTSTRLADRRPPCAPLSRLRISGRIILQDFTIMSRVFSAIADSDESPSTAPTTPDGSLSFSPVLQAAQLLDAFDGTVGVQSRPGKGSSATLNLDGTAPMVVKNICCVGAGYVGELQSNYVSFWLPLQRKYQVPGSLRKINAPRACRR